MRTLGASFLTGLLCAAAASAAPRTTLISRLPVSFEPAADQNGGYVARGRGYVLGVQERENVLTLADPNSKSKVSIRINFLRVKRGVGPIEALEPLVGSHTHYFFGADPRNWRPNVARFGKIRIHELYPGVDLVFYGSAGTLEYDFVVHPGADPSSIEFQIRGAEDVSIDAAGDLVVFAGGEEVRWKAPQLYQNAGVDRIPVEGRFELASGRRVRFRVGKYDHTRTLVIDPVLSYASYLGGSGNDVSSGIATDPAGNVYLAGGASSTNLATTSGVFQSAIGGSPNDAFVAKFSPSGALIYMTYLGGRRNDYAVGIAADAAGNAYITGITNSADFPVTSGAFQKTFAGQGGNGCKPTWFGDAFVVKLSADGSQLVYSTYLGGRRDDFASAIAVDSGGNAYITGFTISLDFPTTSGAYQPSFAGVGGQVGKPICSGLPWFNTGDAFVAKLNANGSALVFSTYLGGSSDEVASTIAVDSSGNAYVGGFTLSRDFPATPAAFQSVFKGFDPQNEFWHTGDGFVAKLSSSGAALRYATYLGGTGDDAVSSIYVSADGSAWVTGCTSSQNFPVTLNALQKNYAGYITLPFLVEQLVGDAFVTHLDANGGSLLYSTFLGGSQNDAGASIRVDSAGLVYVVGFSDSSDFSVSADAIQKKMAGTSGSAPYFQYGDGFVTIIDPNASKMVYSSYFGGSLDDQLLAMVLDGNGGLWATGGTLSPDLPVTAGAAQRTYRGGVPSMEDFKGDAVLVHYSNLSDASLPRILSDGSGVINGGSYISGNVVSGSWVAIKGTGFTDRTMDWSSFDFSKGVLPMTLNGVQVLFNGQAGAIWYLISGTPQQINVQAPANLNGNVSVQVIRNGTLSNTVTTTAVQAAPAIFSYTLDNGTTFYPSAVFTDSTRLGDPAIFPGARKARAGDQVVLFANSLAPSPAGLATVSAPTDPVSVTIGPVTFPADFAGLVAPGEFQINITVPSLPNAGNYPITILINGKSSQPGVMFPYGN